MGILNVTPDSFADATRLTRTEDAVAAALEMEAGGADLIDIGGESSRPGADPVPAVEERRRVVPVIEALAGRLRVPVSVDTYKPEVARAALKGGAVIVNDISGLRYEPALAEVVAETGAALILMHMRGRSKTMYDEAAYANVAAEVAAELAGSIDRATAAGVARERLIVDPGIGFAKRPADSYGVLARLPELASALDRPILVGPSRKSFLSGAVGDQPAWDRDWGTAAAVAAAVLGGAHIVRVHAPWRMAQVARVAEEIRQAQQERHP
jgi:dihydropteroate synthase